MKVFTINKICYIILLIRDKCKEYEMKDEKLLKEFEEELVKNGLSRREALKLLGLSGGLLFLNDELNASTTANASDVKAKIVIVGGGLAGIATAARLVNSLSSPDITIIEPNEKSCFNNNSSLKFYYSSFFRGCRAIKRVEYYFSFK